MLPKQVPEIVGSAIGVMIGELWRSHVQSASLEMQPPVMIGCVLNCLTRNGAAY